MESRLLFTLVTTLTKIMISQKNSKKKETKKPEPKIKKETKKPEPKIKKETKKTRT